MMGLPFQKLHINQTRLEADKTYWLGEPVVMTPAQWCLIPANPRQRATERHARTARHLFKLDPTHIKVAMAVLPDGRKFKVDGHTRSYLWESKKVAGPDHLVVEVWHCADIEAVKALYVRFDNAGAVETSADRLTGALREAGIVLETPLLRDGKFGTAVKRIYDYTRGNSFGTGWKEDEYVNRAVEALKAEILLLDQVRPTPAIFTSGVIQAALVAFRRRGDQALDFWRGLQAGEGIKTGDTCDALYALDAEIKRMKAAKASGAAQQVVLLQKAISAFAAWEKGKTFKVLRNQNTLKGMSEESLRQYMQETFRARGRG